MLRPFASRARARARTSNAVSVPSRPIRRASDRMAASLDLALDAAASLRTDKRAVSCARRKEDAIARAKRQRAGVVEDEIDRAPRAIEQLVVGMGMRFVAV